MNGFIKDMVSNPDGTYSTNRTAGWVCLIVSIGIGVYSLINPNVNEVIAITLYGGFLGAFLGALGISTINTKSYWAYKGEDSKAYWGNQSNGLDKNQQELSNLDTLCPCSFYPNCACGEKERGK